MLYILGLILSKEKFLFCNGYFVCLKDFLFQYIEHRVCTNVCEYVYVPKHRCYIFESLDQKPVYFHTLGTFDDRILCIVARHLQYIVMIVKWRLQIYNKTNIRDLFLVSSPSQFPLSDYLSILVVIILRKVSKLHWSSLDLCII